MLCSSVAMYQCFGEIFCLYRRNRRALFLFNNILDIFFISHVKKLRGCNAEYHFRLFGLVIAFSRSACASAIISSLNHGWKRSCRYRYIYSFRGNLNTSYDCHCAFKVEVKIELTRTPEIRIETGRKQVRNFQHSIKILSRFLIFCLTISTLARFVGKN